MGQMERAYHERCRTAGEYRLYTGFHHVEDVDDGACHEMCPTAGEDRLYTGFDQSRMMSMMFWSHPDQHQTGRALRQKNGGCRRVPEAGNDLHEEHYSVKQYITKSFFMKGVLRQRNTGCILALSVSRMMIMNTISSLSSPKRADTLAKERRGASKAFLRQLSRRAPEAGNDLHQEHYSF